MKTFKLTSHIGKKRAILAVLVFALITGITFGAMRPAEAISVWSDSATPKVTSDSDTTSVELGMKFRSSTATTVTGVKFYKGSGNTGTHTGSLWSATGTKLATVTFSNETATGWQSATFASPVSITANTTYVISYHAPNGRYSVDEGYFANSSVTNGSITALQNGTSGGNGLYGYGSNALFPTSTYNASNYWVDVIVAAAETTPPTVNLTAPVNGAAVTGTVTVAATATDNAAVSNVQFKLDGANLGTADTTSPYSVSWNSANVVNGSHKLTAVATDSSGNQTTSSTVTVTVTNQAAPSVTGIWPNTTTPTVATNNDSASVELGVKFRSAVATTINGVRFYKGSGNTGTHTGSLWTSTGTRLATVTFTGETATGWQAATFATPVSISANTTYVVSYFAPAGRYAINADYFAKAAYTNGNLTALQNGTDGGNGVYRYGSAGGFPNSTYGASNYWVDVIAGTPTATTPAPTTPEVDTTAPTVQSVTPTNGSTNVATTASLTATVSEALTASTVSSSSVTLRGSQGAIATTVSYDANQKRVTLTPATELEAGATYTATLTTAIKDVAGNALATSYTWTFSTAPAVIGTVSPLAQGPGGPILLVTKTGQAFSEYYSEILRAEGLNSFSTVEVGSVTSATLAKHEVVVLGDMTLTAAQVTLFTNWVNDGGNLVAMHPDKKLAGLLGITDQSATLSDAYLKVNTSAAPGTGITDQTMQFHGTADRYTVNSGTSTVASLYNSSSAAVSNPAVTLRSVGTSGGQAAAFTYDLARSVVYTHQGNPAWSGQDRDGNGVVRSNDLFYGAMSGDMKTDYVDLTKVAIPQADEQQRLLANIILEINKDNQPLPKLSYLPYNDKAVVVLAADDHATNSGITQLNYQIAQSAAGCSAADWQCIRSTNLIYTNTPLTNAQAANYYAQGFDFGTHMSTGCSNWTVDSLNASIRSELTSFQQKYTSLPTQHVNRIHCIAWSDYVSAAKAEAANGLRIDMNYYYWPGEWVQNRPGYMTGSGLNMRFADTDGTMIDTYQLPSHLVNESGQTFPQNITTMLDRALGPEGYYGVLGTHYDYSDGFDQQLIQAAKARNVRLVSAQQILDWTDGRNASSFSNSSWNGSTYTFTANINAKMRSMGRALVPIASKNGNIVSVNKDGRAVTFTTETMKGISYAVIPVTSGTYSVVYGQDTTPPTVTAVAPADSATKVGVGMSPKLTFSEPLMSSTVNAANIQLLAGSTIVAATVSYNAADNSVTIDPTASLVANTAYTVLVSTALTDATGVTLASPYSSGFMTGEAGFSLWAPAAQVVSADTGSALEVGLRFTSSQNGTITKLQFYKSASDTSTSHTMTLWNANGVSLGTATTGVETTSGWQTATFSVPIAVTANTTYTASYRAANGVYSYTTAGLAGAVTNGPLTALAGGGVFVYGSGVPSQSYNNANYWLDLVFIPTN